MKKILLILAAMLTAVTTWASTFTVTNNDNVFTITRDGSGTETVYYRTVTLTAMPVENYTDIVGAYTFTGDETQHSFTINEVEPSTYLDPDHGQYNLLYIIQTTTGRSYRFEVLDSKGDLLDYVDREIKYTKYYKMPADYSNKSVTDLAYFDDDGNLQSGAGNKYIDIGPHFISGYPNSSGWRKVTDDGYGQGYCQLSTDLFNGAYVSRIYANQRGMKVYATVIFKQKEDDDGYQYIQILGNNQETYDGNDPDGAVNVPEISQYKACFELSKSGVTSSPHYQFFPHRYNYVNKAAEQNAGLTHYSFDYNNSYLYEQKYVDNSVHPSSSGSMILSPTDYYIYVRFDAAGNYDDDWYFADLKLRLALVDAINPTVINNYKMNGGRHSKTNTVYVNVPFSEIVTVDGAPKLYTTWGELNYLTGSGTNVLTFSGTISTSASGTFTVNSYGGGTIADLAGNLLTGEISHAFGTNLDANTYSISYDLAGGSWSSSGGSHPTSYTDTSGPITLSQPVRDGYTFLGWTGSNGNTPQLNVTIPTGTVGDLSYTANWKIVNYNITYNLNGGSLPADQSNPTTYTIETPTFTLNNPTKPNYDFIGWTGSNGSTPQTTVSVSQGHWGDMSFTANWKICRYTFDSATGALSLNWGEFNSGNKWGDDVPASAVKSVTATSQVSFTGDCSNLFAGFYNCTSMDLNSVNTSAATNMKRMFFNCGALSTLNISNWDTGNVTNMSWMFSISGTSALQLDISGWDTGKVTDLSDMFYLYNGSSLDLSGWDTGNVTTMEEMFGDCSSLTTLNISGWNTSKVGNMTYMFDTCSSLKMLNLTGWDTSNVIGMIGMFADCASLTTVYAHTSWDVGNVTSSNRMFTGCTNLVGGLGTTFDSNYTDKTYARIDHGAELPGYLTGVFTLTLPEDVTASATPVFSIGDTAYYTAGTTVTLTYNGNVPEGKIVVFAVNGTAIEGNTFEMPIDNVTVTVEIAAVGVLGDVNGDGEVTTVDITAIYNYLLNGDETFIATSDVDGDGFITTTDITVIYNILLGSKK